MPFEQLSRKNNFLYLLLSLVALLFSSAVTDDFPEGFGEDLFDCFIFSRVRFPKSAEGECLRIMARGGEEQGGIVHPSIDIANRVGRCGWRVEIEQDAMRFARAFRC
jgi:hypothetical protein